MDMNVGSAITADDVTESIRATALLADLTVSIWRAEKLDRKVTDQLKEDNNAIGSTGRFVKNLLSGADTPLKATCSAFTQARTTHFSLTLPWIANPHAERMGGPRLLPNMLFEKYLDAMQRVKRAANQQLDSFLIEYPNLIQQAQANLGGLANPSDYPSVDQVRASFALSFDFQPIPDGRAFQGLNEDVLGALSRALERKHVRMIEGTQHALWEKVRERVTYMCDKLSDANAEFKASTIEHVRELLGLLPAWNLSQDPRVTEIVADIDEMLTGIDAADLRKDARMRADVANQARGVTEKLNAWSL